MGKKGALRKSKAYIFGSLAAAVITGYLAGYLTILLSLFVLSKLPDSWLIYLPALSLGSYFLEIILLILSVYFTTKLAYPGLVPLVSILSFLSQGLVFLLAPLVLDTSFPLVLSPLLPGKEFLGNPATAYLFTVLLATSLILLEKER